MVKASCKKLTWMPLLFMEYIEAKKESGKSHGTCRSLLYTLRDSNPRPTD